MLKRKNAGKRSAEDSNLNLNSTLTILSVGTDYEIAHMQIEDKEQPHTSFLMVSFTGSSTFTFANAANEKPSVC